MKNRVENVTKIGRVPEELRVEHKGFAEWDAFTSPKDHGAIVQVSTSWHLQNFYIVLNSNQLFFLRYIKSVVELVFLTQRFLQILLDNNQDVEGQSLPKLVYLAREKRPNHFHNFKAGAMNALVSI